MKRVDPEQLVRDLWGLKKTLGSKEKGGASEDAAKAVAPLAADQRGRFAKFYYDTFPSGWTADEVAAQFNVSPFSARPRISELHQVGLIKKTNERRRNRSCQTATVWVATELLVGERAVAAAEGLNPGVIPPE
ncbi:DNA-binding transcriptional regulator LsrR (DeoR family) [Bradyrhizobium sp. USDA 4449]